MSAAAKRFLACWGNGDYGRLGHGIKCWSADTPHIVASLRQRCIVALSCGHAHTAVVEEDGSVYSMGLNDSGQLGHSSDAHFVPEPKEMLLPEAVTQVAAGSRHTLFLTESGEVWAVGSNSSGQLGLGSAIMQTFAPRRLPALVGAGIVGIAAGEKHSLAVTGEGELLSWGAGSQGQLGHGAAAVPTNRDEAHPRLISSLKGRAVQAAAAGMARSGCVDDSGQAWTWGDNANHELGHKEPTPVSDPTQVELTTVSQLAFGGSTTLALFGLGAICRWGGHESGFSGSKSPLEFQRNIAIPGLVETVSCGWKHSAAVTAEGRLFCWGWGGSEGSSFRARMSGGAAFCVGPQSFDYYRHCSKGSSNLQSPVSCGQLGLGDENDYWEPTRVSSLSDENKVLTNKDDESIAWKALKVSCGLNHTAAIVEVV